MLCPRPGRLYFYVCHNGEYSAVVQLRELLTDGFLDALPYPIDIESTVLDAGHVLRRITEETAGEIVKRWENRGLVSESASGRRVELTKQGVATDVVVDDSEPVPDDYLPPGMGETFTGP